MASPQLPTLGRRGEGWVAAQVVLLGLVVLVEAYGPAWPGSVATVSFAAGVTVSVLGLVLFVAGVFALGRSLTPFPRPTDTGSLNEGGAYGLVRHPIYAGVILAVAGWSLASTPIGLAMTVLVAGFLELKSRREEDWLLAHYRGYEEYRRRVRWKFLPGVH